MIIDTRTRWNSNFYSVFKTYNTGFTQEAKFKRLYYRFKNGKILKEITYACLYKLDANYKAKYYTRLASFSPFTKLNIYKPILHNRN